MPRRPDEEWVNAAAAEHWDGTSWALQTTPSPAGTTQAGLYAVSCASPSSCTAVGQYYANSGGAERPLVEHWDGISWTVQHAPLPDLASGAQLGAVSCPTALDCVAVGSYSMIGQNTGLFAERWNGSQWTAQVMPHPAGTSFLLTSVSCRQPEQCIAVGGSFNGTQRAQSIVERANGTSWTLQADAAPASTLLFGVSCTSGQSCTAVGVAPSNTVAEHWDGTSWALQAIPTVTGPELYGVSCLGPLTCTAVGIKGPPERPLAEQEG